MMILKIWRVWLKNQARHAHLYFELKMAANRSILKLQKSLKIFFHKKIISVGVCFLYFCSSLTGFWIIVKNAIFTW